VDVQMELQGNGQTIDKVTHTLTGHLLAKMGEGNIENGEILKKANFVSSMINNLNPLVKTEPNTKLECAVVNFRAKDGILSAHNGIGVRLNQVDVLGAGTIDLKKNKLDIHIKPHLRKGIKISLTDFAQLIHLAGPINDPSISIDPEGLLKKSGSIAAAIFTGGLSTVTRTLFSTLKEDANPCEVALTGVN